MFSVVCLFLLPGQIETVSSADFSKAAQRAAVTATVRVVNAAQKVSGSGAVIGRKGKAVYLLTARHIVRGSDTVEVATFSAGSYPKPSRAYRAKVVATSDAAADLALLRLDTDDDPPGLVRVCPPLVVPKKKVLPGLAVGCTKGGAPTCQIGKVRGPKRVRHKGADRAVSVWEVNHQHAAGRSGGPLIDKRGYLIGVCSGTTKGKGYFCHVAEIHAFLKRNGLEKLLKP
jgi:S1-C subfamily serine protease